MLTVVQRGGGIRGKPPELVRGVSSRLPWVWDGLCFAVPFNDATRDGARDVLTNAAPTDATGLVWTRDPQGGPAANLGLDSRIEYADNPTQDRPTTALTAYVRFQRAGSPDINPALFTKRYGPSSPWVTWKIQPADANNNTLAGALAVNGVWRYFDTATAYPIPIGGWHSAFLRWQSGTPPYLDVLGDDGNLLSRDAYTSDVTGTLSYGSSQYIVINEAEVVGEGYNADYSQAMVWSRRLTDTEVQALVADPFGWYSPRRSTVITNSPYALPFGGGEMHGMGGGGGMY